ncbi:DUF1003 domain-containing protein [Micrococcus sp. FDAARGOS_333]|uniref:DUF1003 domain-containing protein n=1 Tax=Micrococcus sp. FDAARGOS_333 TaxID=1930558 RepID=UPI001D1252DF|nr:DUF1003 domain-containing protein [Micrococcus sp. FDAARGOS_333]
MAENANDPRTRQSGLDTPLSARRRRLPRLSPDPDAFGEATEGFARFMGTPQFLLWMTLFCALWLGWNTWGPESLRFDDAAIGFTALTLMLSLQASYAAPLLLLAQNRQDDRDKVALREDRDRAERNLADTEYLTREIAGLRLALQDVSTRDFVRSEMRSLSDDIVEQLRESLREEIRNEIRNDLLEARSADRDKKATKKDSAKKSSKKKRGARPADAEDTSTTTLALLAAEEAAEAAAERPQEGPQA